MYASMSKEEQEKLPILGNTRTWGGNPNEPELAQPIDEEDDLPF